ncbi:MAG: Y-family DNA polymerase, partial [Chlorobium sp.]
MELVRPAKQSICTSRSFGKSVTTWEELHRAVATFTGKCAIKLRKEGAAASLLTLFIGTSPFEAKETQYWGTKTASLLPYPTQDSIALQRAAQLLLESVFRSGYAYKKAGVIVSDLMPVQSSGRTLSLFPEDQPAPNERDKKLMLVMDGINPKFLDQKPYNLLISNK